MHTFLHVFNFNIYWGFDGLVYLACNHLTKNKPDSKVYHTFDQLLPYILKKSVKLVVCHRSIFKVYSPVWMHFHTYSQFCTRARGSNKDFFQFEYYRERTRGFEQKRTPTKRVRNRKKGGLVVEFFLLWAPDYIPERATTRWVTLQCSSVWESARVCSFKLCFMYPHLQDWKVLQF